MSIKYSFLRLRDVLNIHREQLRLFGGQDGVRDWGLLSSAIATPRATFDGELLHPDELAMGAAYLFHICKNHPFLDGNKRTALGSAGLFLRLNGFDLNASQEQLYEVTFGVADGSISKAQAVEFFQTHVHPNLT